MLRAVDTDVSAHLGVRGQVVPGGSTTGIKRFTTYNYPSAGADENLKEGVLLELGSRGGAYPAARYSYRSLACEFAETELGEDAETWAEFAAFDVLVLAPERTLLEKLAAVHDAAARENTELLAKAGRHFYDVCCLLESPSVRNSLSTLGADGVTTLVDDINQHSAAAGFSWTPRPSGGYGDSPAFDVAHPSHPAVIAGHAAAAGPIYGDVPSIDRVFRAVSESRALL